MAIIVTIKIPTRHVTSVIIHAEICGNLCSGISLFLMLSKAILDNAQREEYLPSFFLFFFKFTCISSIHHPYKYRISAEACSSLRSREREREREKEFAAQVCEKIAEDFIGTFAHSRKKTFIFLSFRIPAISARSFAGTKLSEVANLANNWLSNRVSPPTQSRQTCFPSTRNEIYYT